MTTEELVAMLETGDLMRVIALHERGDVTTEQLLAATEAYKNATWVRRWFYWTLDLVFGK